MLKNFRCSYEKKPHTFIQNQLLNTFIEDQGAKIGVKESYHNQIIWIHKQLILKDQRGFG